MGNSFTEKLERYSNKLPSNREIATTEQSKIKKMSKKISEKLKKETVKIKVNDRTTIFVTQDKLDELGKETIIQNYLNNVSNNRVNI